MAIEAVRELVRRNIEVELCVVGDGPLRGRLATSALELPVTFVGHINDRAALATILAGARALIAPCGTETFGLAVLEAMACGTPVLVPPDGGAHELVTANTGLVVPPDGASVALAVERILCDGPAAQSRACRAHALDFSWDETAAALLDLFTQITRRTALGTRSTGVAVGQ